MQRSLICVICCLGLADAQTAATKCVDGDARACYSCGETAWRQSNLATMSARAKAGLKPTEAGPLPQLRARIDLRNGFLGMVDEGLMCLARAVSIDLADTGSMAMMSQLWHVRAEMEDDREAYSRDVATADEWLLRTGKPIRMGADYQSDYLVKAVQPAYPILARQARVQGQVRLDVTVGKDGHVLNVILLEGHPLLTHAAISAAKEEIYRPFSLRGQAVEVITDVLVTFTLM